MKDNCKIKSVTYSTDKNIISLYNRLKSVMNDKTLLARSIAGKFPNDSVDRIGEILNWKDFTKDFFGKQEMVKKTNSKEFNKIIKSREKVQKELHHDIYNVESFYKEQKEIIKDKYILAQLIKKEFPALTASSIMRVTGWKQYIVYSKTKKQILEREIAQKGFRKKHYKKKQDLLIKIKNELGGKCSCCGYNKCFAALDFHHLNTEEKEGRISDFHKEEDMRKEAEKCILLCSNCHREEHERLRNLE